MHSALAQIQPVRYPLVAIWVCFLVRSFFYASLLPLWEGYDEWAHYAFVQHLVTNGNLPLGGRDRISREVEQSLRLAPGPWDPHPLPGSPIPHDEYWKLSGPERERREQQLRSLPPEWASQIATENLLLYEALQPPLYYWSSSGLLRLIETYPLATRALILRWWSVAIASAVVPLGFLVALLVFQNEKLALGTVALLSAMPELMIDVARVGNDCLAIVLFTLLLYLTLRIVEDFQHKGLACALGAVLGLGLLTKAYFLTVLPALLFIFTWYFQKRVAERNSILASGAIAAAVAMIISGWWYLRNVLTTGTISGLGESVVLQERGISLLEQLRQIPQVSWGRALDSILFSHIWFGGWSALQVRSWMYHLFYWIVFTAAIGLAVGIWRLWRGQNVSSSCSISPGHILVLSVPYAFFWIGQAYNVLLLFLTKGASTSMGWYMYCVIVSEIILTTIGLLAISPTRLRRWILPGATACFAALDLYTVHFLLIPYYTGLTAHRPDGPVAAFHLGLLDQVGFHELLVRLLTSKSDLLSTPALAVMWFLFIVSTLALLPLTSPQLTFGNGLRRAAGIPGTP